MVKHKSTPKKFDTYEYGCMNYTPVIKKRKRKTPIIKSEKKFTIRGPSGISEKFYIGQFLLGHTNNIFPAEYLMVKVSFRISQNESEGEDSVENCENSEAIIVDFDKISVVVKMHTDINLIKELVSLKEFCFKFVHDDGNVYLKIYFENLPLPKFYTKLGNAIKTLCSLFFNQPIADDSPLSSHKKFQKAGEIIKFYEKLIEKRNNCPDIAKENVQHHLLRPSLRPYQEKSVQWMLHRERIEKSQPDLLHPLYVPIKLESGLEIYFDKYTGYITSEKPQIFPTSKGGILADEMGLGKTVEVLACILQNPKEVPNTETLKNSCETNSLLLVKQKNGKLVIENSDDDDDLELTPQKRKRASYYSDEEYESDRPLIKRKMRKKKFDSSVQNSQYVDKSKVIKISDDIVKSSKKKSVNKISLEMFYNSVLSEMSTVKSASYEDPNRIVVQCICGSTDEEETIKCTKCPKYQHMECLGYEKSLGEYICPQCWMDEPLLESKATLIVTPVTLKSQWRKEICRHVKGNLKVLQYEGVNSTSIYPTELKDYDVVLTTYNVLQKELRLTENGQVFNLRNERKYSAPGSPLTRLKWWRLCLDEAQTVEMPGRMVSEMARKIDAVHRWAVTGTPISKNVSDLYGLIDYLQITPYNDLTTWKKVLYEPYLNGDEEPLLIFFSELLWRTAKKDVADQINIPKQTYLEHTLEFSAVEKYFYKREHELICSDFFSKVMKFDLSIQLQNLDKSTLKKLLAPLLTLRHACTHPNTTRGRYLATKKQVTSMKELLDALILKNTNDSEECLQLIITSLNGISGIHLLLQNPQEAINHYRQVLQLVARFSEDSNETKLSVDKPQIIHTLYNLADVLDVYPPAQPTLRDQNLRIDCDLVEKKYMDKFLSECSSAFDSFSSIMLNVEKMQNNFVLKDGQWYSDGLNFIVINGHFEELKNKIQTTCDNANLQNKLSASANERTLLTSIYNWDDDLSTLRSNLFESIEDLYDYTPESEYKIVVKKDLVVKAMNCHLRPQKKGKQAPKCAVCIANDHLKKYEVKLFEMFKRGSTFEEMSLKGSWKPTFQELVMRAILAVLKSRHSKNEYIKDGELQISIIDLLKKEFKELRRLWTFLDQQICAKDELAICKIRLQLKMDDENVKVNNTLKNLDYDIENKTETIHLLGVHELDYQMSLLENDYKQNSTKLEKLLGTQSYLETLRKQQYEGQNPDPCPICKNPLEQHWSILLCGHSYCLECIQVLLEQTAGVHIQCSICRNKQKYEEISYIKAGNTVTDDDTKTIKGNFSTKIEGVVKLLLDLRNEDVSVKVLLFSSWVTVLKCLKEALDTNSITCELANVGNLDLKITNFKDPTKEIMVFLLPIQLGSKGLNLIEATHVILVEPLLDPADELQAIGRINRIGQTKATFVHKFLIKNTIEENIHSATTSNAESWEQSHVTLQHLVDLFNTRESATNSSQSVVLETF